ncbi:MAG TPA: nuclear transport factor 2 family protein [Gemmatimonadaceae bacterium]|nr:nuclear transport factor 2 family protein [Gemmatimonadaceae bacterium]
MAIGIRLCIAAGSALTLACASGGVRQELERAYALNRKAFLDRDVDAVMALRTADYYTIAPDGQVRDREAMRQYTIGFLNGVVKWIDTRFDIDSLQMVNGDAVAIVRQYADRMGLRPDGQVHHIQTWVTQRETWRKTADGWKLRVVDQVHDQRRLVDGKPQ